MTNKDNRNRLFGAGLILAGVLGLMAPPIPATNVCPTELLGKAGIHVGYLMAPTTPRPTHTRTVKVVNVTVSKICLPRL